jgi:hypothetical protein
MAYVLLNFNLERWGAVPLRYPHLRQSQVSALKLSAVYAVCEAEPTTESLSKLLPISIAVCLAVN